MTPEQIERIRKAAEELQAALSDSRAHVGMRHDMLEVTSFGDSTPKYVHALHLTAISELRIFP